MRVTYLYHSGFSLEWESCVWIFDYYKGELPVWKKDKKIFVFSSHWHQDHLNPEIFGKLKEYSDVTYVFSSDIRKKIKRYQVPEDFLSLITYMKPEEKRRFSWSKGEIQVRTLRSTDCGVAFLVTYQGRAVYHAGDLNCWTWEEEEESVQKQMEADYIRELEKIRGEQVLAAFVPLDPRLGKQYAKGMDYYREIVGAAYLFPMHMWEDYSVVERYQREANEQKKEEIPLQQVREEGQQWEVSIEEKM